MRLWLTEPPSVEVLGEDALIIFPTRPYWFTASREVVDILELLAVPIDLETLVLKVADALKVSDQESRETIEEIRELLFQNKVLCVDGQLNSEVNELEPHEQVNSIENVVVIAATHGCNLRCPQCYSASNSPLTNELTTDEIKSLVDDLDQLGWDRTGASIGLTGGEFFTRPDAMELIEYICDKEYSIMLATNSLLLSGQQIAQLGRLKDQLKVSVSLDGSRAETHEFIRGAGTFDATVQAIEALCAEDLSVGVNMFVHQGNFQEIESTLALVDKLGVTAFNCLSMMQVGRANTVRSQAQIERVSEDELYAELFRILRWNATYRELMKNSTFANQLMGVAAGVKSHYCGVGSYRALYVRADGNVYPCPDTGLPVFQLGNVRDKSLSEIWETSPMLADLRKLNVDSMNPTCAECDVRYQCGGNCRGENYQVSHQLKAPHFKCEELRRTIKSMMWMLTEEPDLFSEKVSGLYQKLCI